MTAVLISDVDVRQDADHPLRRHQDLLIEDGTISALAPTGTLPESHGTRLRRIDGTGLTAVPGLFDCHIHATTDKHQPALTGVTEPESAKTLRAVPNLAATLATGFTSARDLAGADSGFREAVDAGIIAGPELQIAIRILSITGGHGDWRTTDGNPLDFGPGAGGIGDGPSDFLRLTREVIRQGADWIKVAATGGMGSPGSHPEGGGLSEAEIRVVVEETARHPVRGVAAHAIGTAGIIAAARAGVTTIEHGYLIDEEGIDLLGERGTVLVPTLATLTREVDENAAPWVVRKRARSVAEARERLGAALAAGVRVACGTDAGIAAHGANRTELALLVEFGLSPAEALRAATQTPAALFGREKELGTIARGMRADLLLSEVDPLEDMTAFAYGPRPRVVLQRGRVVAESPASPVQL